MRLDKYLAESTVGTRKKARTLIQSGLVKVNDLLVMDPSIEIQEDQDQIYLDQVLTVHRGKVYYVFHKPMGCVTARSDATSKTVMDYVSQVELELFPVGRLDKDTEGLLLLTNDGDFCNELMHPREHICKTYEFWALGVPEESRLQALRGGISIGEEHPAIAKEISVLKQGSFQEFENQLTLGATYRIKKIPSHQPMFYGTMTITEGRKHQIKRMLKAVGCFVVYLKRTRIGSLELPGDLEPGEYRQLSYQELQTLWK